jgi:hypothetical protein
MTSLTRRSFAVGTLAISLSLAVLGWRGFSEAVPVDPSDSDGSPRFDGPTISEMIHSDVLTKKLGCLVLAIVGIGGAGYSILAFCGKRDEREDDAA